MTYQIMMDRIVKSKRLRCPVDVEFWSLLDQLRRGVPLGSVEIR